MRRKIVINGKHHHVMRKVEVEREISTLVGVQVKVSTEINRGRSFARCTIDGFEYEGEAQSADWAYRALLMFIRKEVDEGRLGTGVARASTFSVV